MTIETLIARLESLGYSFVTVVAEHADYYDMTAVDPNGYQIELNALENDAEPPIISLVVDRVVGSNFWDITFIGGESFL